MDLKDIQELIKFVAKSGATEVDLEIDNIKISIKSPAKKKRGEAEEPVNIIQQVPVHSVTTPIPTTENISSEAIIKSDSDEHEDSHLIEIKSSMIGTFYRSASPDKSPNLDVESPEKLEAQADQRRELLVSSEAKSKIQEM